MGDVFKIWSHDVAGNDGHTYSLRTMLTEAEVRGLQAAGVLPGSVAEVIGMQTAADQLAAMYEREAFVCKGGRLA